MKSPTNREHRIRRPNREAARRLGQALLAALLIAAAGPVATTSAAGHPLRGEGSATPPAVMKKIASFNDPTYVTGAPGFPGLLFVTQRAGQVEVVANGHKQARPFVNISARVMETASEQGLLGLAFPPDYKKSGRFYVQYTDANDDLQIDEYRRSTPTFARASSRRAVLTAPEPEGYGNHNGGQLQFRGELLYSGIGDGMDPGDLFNYAQNVDNLRGKIIRIDPRPGAGESPTGSRRATRSSGALGATRSSATACETRTASPSRR